MSVARRAGRWAGRRIGTGITAAGIALPGVLAVPSAASAATCPAPGGATIAKAPAPVDAEVVFSGGGLGHGLGLSQYGAQGAARLGCTAAQILSRYYDGAALQARTMPAEVRLWMLQDGQRAQVLAENGPVQWHLRDGTVPLPGATLVTPPVQPTGSTWRVGLDATRTRLELRDVLNGVLVWTGAAGQGLTARHSGSVISLTTYAKDGAVHLKRRLRWDETRFSFDASGLDVVQSIGTTSVGSAMDKYLWGLGEVPISWTRTAHEALRAQAVAARTYAYLKLRSGTILQPTPVHQNYTGYTKEAQDADYRDGAGRNLRWRDAVNTTRGQVVVTASGSVVNTLYSSSFGGHSEDVRYVWGGSEISYLHPLDDSVWDAASDNPNKAWARGLTLQQVADKLGFTSVSAISVAPRGSTARLEGVKVTGVRNGVPTTTLFEGWDVRTKLGLPSPGFTVSVRPIGGPAAQPLVGDWDGDGDSDPGWYKDGAVALRLGDGSTHRFRYGQAGDRALVGDWDGDGKDSLGVYRAGSWRLRNTLTAGKAHAVVSYPAPAATAQPVVGDWDGNGRDGLGFVHGTEWHLRNPLTAGRDEVVLRYGSTGDTPVVGDWDGNGTDTPGVWRAGSWYLRNKLSSGSHQVTFAFGAATDRPVVGDWNRDGRTSAGAVRGTRWYRTNGRVTTTASGTTTFRG